MNQEAIICVEDVSFRYPDTEHTVLDHVSLEVAKGCFLAVLGRNGSGKSTLAKLLNALLMPTEGKVVVNGKTAQSEEDRYDIRSACGMVFQNPDNQIVATIVEEDCAFGLENTGVEPSEIQRRVDEALAGVGMSAFAKMSPAMLSGGQKQRVAVAGVMAMRPKVIVFDESTAMLDPVGRRDILRLAKQLNAEHGITVVWITHFMDEAVQADRIIVMDEGKIALRGTPTEVFSQVEQVEALGLEVPEMMRFARMLRREGLTKLNPNIMTVDEMVEAICRLK